MEASIESYYKIVGANLKTIRKERGLSQVGLAHLCNKIDRAKISDIENAKEDFMYSTLIEICVGLKIKIEELVIEKIPIELNI